MDEPTRSLDPVIARDLRTFIRETLVDRLGRTVVLVTHRLEEAEELCDRVAIMNHGRIIACGPLSLQPMARPDFSSYFTPFLKRLLPDLLVMGRRPEKLGYLLRLLTPPRDWLVHYYSLGGSTHVWAHHLLHPLKLAYHLTEELLKVLASRLTARP